MAVPGLADARDVSRFVALSLVPFEVLRNFDIRKIRLPDGRQVGFKVKRFKIAPSPLLKESGEFRIPLDDL